MHARRCNRLFERAVSLHGMPQKITVDGDAASHAAVAELRGAGTLFKELIVRTSRYLNNLIEQDHRRVKQRVRPMLGFQRFAYAAVTLAGIELVNQIKKKQFDLLDLCPPHARTPQVREAVLAA